MLQLQLNHISFQMLIILCSLFFPTPFIVPLRIINLSWILKWYHNVFLWHGNQHKSTFACMLPYFFVRSNIKIIFILILLELSHRQSWLGCIHIYKSLDRCWLTFSSLLLKFSVNKPKIKQQTAAFTACNMMRSRRANSCGMTALLIFLNSH